MLKREDRITFEDFGIEFTDEDFEGVDKETSRRKNRRICRRFS